MESMCCRHTLLSLVACFVLVEVKEVTGFGYLDSLSTPLPKTSNDCGNADRPIATQHPDEAMSSTGTSSSTTTTTTRDANTGWTEIIKETPDDHYAKDHPGAGWAGYKHPVYGGYLDHLSSEAAAPTSDCVLEAGKKADYGDDIRWGTQVYLDKLN